MAAGPYVGVAGGVSIFHDSDISESGIDATAEYDTGYGLNLSAGYNFDPVRVEFEFGYKKADVDKFKAFGFSESVNDSDLAVMSYMANAYYDFKTNSTVTPYVGAGLGMINGEFSSPGYDSDDTVFGYQLIAGVGFNVNKNLIIDLSYRFQGAAEDFSIDGTDVSYMSSSIMAGLRFNF